MNIKIVLPFLLSLLPMIVVGQNDSSIQTLSEIKIASPINNIYDSFVENDKIIVLSDTRVNGDLDILISVLDLAGNLVNEVIIGEKNAFERPAYLSKMKTKRYLLANVFIEGKNKLMLSTLDAHYNLIEQREISINNLEQGNTMLINGDKAKIAASIRDNAGNFYPCIIEYNLLSGAIESEFLLDRQNYQTAEKFEKVTEFSRDERGNPVKEREVQALVDNTLNKTCNQMKFSNKLTDEFILLGLESNDKITDFWTCLIQQGKIVWENIYPSKSGGDEGLDLFVLEDGNYLLSGIGYTKTIAENYEIRNMLINAKGEVLKEETIKDKTRTIYKDGVKMNSNKYVFLGQSELIDYTNDPYGLNSESSDVSIFIFDKDLKLISKNTLETKTKEEVLNVIALSEKEIGVFYSVEKNITFRRIAVE